MRNIELNLGTIQIGQAQHDAVSHLSLWSFIPTSQDASYPASQAYDKLSIYQEGNGMNICGFFSHTTKPGRYFIMAVYNETTGTYSFHS